MNIPRPLHVRAAGEELPDDALVEELRGLLDEVAGAGGAETAGDDHGPDGFALLAERMALLSDPRRLQLLFCLHAHPGVRSSDLARVIGAHESTTSHALALLREAGWVRAIRSGREVRYELADGVVHSLLHDLGSDHLPGVRHHDNHRHG